MRILLRSIAFYLLLHGILGTLIASIAVLHWNLKGRDVDVVLAGLCVWMTPIVGMAGFSIAKTIRAERKWAERYRTFADYAADCAERLKSVDMARPEDEVLDELVVFARELFVGSLPRCCPTRLPRAPEGFGTLVLEVGDSANGVVEENVVAVVLYILRKLDLNLVQVGFTIEEEGQRPWLMAYVGHTLNETTGECYGMLFELGNIARQGVAATFNYSLTPFTFLSKSFRWPGAEDGFTDDVTTLLRFNRSATNNYAVGPLDLLESIWRGYPFTNRSFRTGLPLALGESVVWFMANDGVRRVRVSPHIYSELGNWILLMGNSLQSAKPHIEARIAKRNQEIQEMEQET